MIATLGYVAMLDSHGAALVLLKHASSQVKFEQLKNCHLNKEFEMKFWSRHHHGDFKLL